MKKQRKASTALVLVSDNDAQGDMLTAELIDPERPADDPLDDDIPGDEVSVSSAVDRGEAPNRITVLTDHKLEYPDLWLAVYIAGDQFEQSQFASMFVRAACRRAASPQEADLVVFTGGVDVDPQLYGASRHHSTGISVERDNRDMALYLDCLENGIPMFGVCRGAQFLHVMNGGKLFQDVDNHYGDHSMVDIRTKETIEKVSSVHHQMCAPNRGGGMEILATCGKSRVRAVDAKKTDRGTNADIEAFFYKDTCCLGVQGHPEYKGYNYYTKWCLHQIEQYVLLNSDVDWEEVVVKDENDEPEKLTLRRVLPELREKRKLLVQAIADKASR